MHNTVIFHNQFASLFYTIIYLIILHEYLKNIALTVEQCFVIVISITIYVFLSVSSGPKFDYNELL